MPGPESKPAARAALSEAEAGDNPPIVQRPRHRTLLRILAALVVAGFVAWSAKGLAERWSQSPPVDVAWTLVLASVLPLLLASFLHALGWLQIVRRLADTTALKPGSAMRLFLASILGRYVPGKLGMPAILVAGAPAVGMARTTVGSSLLLMVMVYVVTGLAVGLSAIALTNTAGGSQDLMSQDSAKGVTAVLMMGTLLLALIDRRYLPVKLRRLVGDRAGTILPWSSIALFVLTWCGWLGHGMCLSASVGGTWGDALSSSGFFALAPVIGVLALVTPGGIGVREAVIVAGCTPSLGAAPALAVALLSRVISLSVEVAAWLSAAAFERVSSSR